ncbi:hypothetical protein ACQY0O_000866 [Thecaphora frezii]
MPLDDLPQGQHAAGAAQILMPRKRQHGFDLGGAVGSHANAPNHTAHTGFSTGASEHKPAVTMSSFIDTDILLSDELWNQLSTGASDLAAFHHGGGAPDQNKQGMAHSHTGAMAIHDVSMGEASQQQPHALHQGFVHIPQSQPAGFFGTHGGSFNSFVSRSSHHGDYRIFDRGGTGSMEEEDSPDGSNGDTASTIATSITSPSSHGTMASTLSKSMQNRHKRSGSNASSSHAKGRSGRSISRSNLKTIPQEQARTAERSPSQDRGGVGKAPTCRSRPSRRASIGPAAQAAVQASVNGHLRIDAQGAAVSVGAFGKQEPRSPSTTNLSSSVHTAQSRWSMFGGGGSGGGDVQEPSALSNLHMADQRPFASWAQCISQSQPGVSHPTSASLPAALSFQANMQHLQLKMPPVSGAKLKSSRDDAMREASAEPYNPFLFPPYAQPSETSSNRRQSDVSVTSRPTGHEAQHEASFFEVLSLDSSSSPTRSPSQPAEHAQSDATNSSSKSAKPTAPTQPATVKKERKASKSGTQAPTKKVLQEVREEADRNARPRPNGKTAASEDNDEDTLFDDEDEDQPLATMSKSETEAKCLAEKRRRRRESHNAVERRRRDNINEKITELATLLPEAMLLDAIATSTQGGNSGAFAPALAAKAALAAAAAAAARDGTLQEGIRPALSEADLSKSSAAAYAAALAPVHANSAALAAAQAKPNKGIILRKSVEYIRHLQQFLDMQMDRIGFLEAELQHHREVMQCSGMQVPPMPIQPAEDPIGFSSAFGGDGPGGFFVTPAMGHDINARNLMELGLPVQHRGESGGPLVQQAPSQSQEEQGEAASASLMDWLEGFDQRTGLPRRSSVDPIEEEDEHEGADKPHDPGQRGRGRYAHRDQGHVEEEEERGRSRQRGNGSSQSQHGSWPALEMTGSRSPMHLPGEAARDEGARRDLLQLVEFKMEA